GGIGAVQREIRFPGNTERSPHQALELALYRCGKIGAVLLELELCLNADVFEEALHQLGVVDEVATKASRDGKLGFKALGKPGFCQQASSFLRVVLVILRPGAELVDGL